MGLTSDGARRFGPYGGEVGALMRTFDWSRTDVGPPDSWPRSLQSYVSMILEMPSPAIIFWGPRQTQLYNDGYAVIMGPRHPQYLAASYQDCWPETYPVIHPWMRRVLEGEVVQVTDQLFTLTRHGFEEEAYFTFTFSPLRDDDGAIAGILQPVVEVTDRVLADRRAETLRCLASPVTGACPREPGRTAALSDNPKDVPFSLLFLWDESEERLELTDWSGFGEQRPSDATRRSASATARRVFDSGSAATIDGVDQLLGGSSVGCWPEAPRMAYALPLRGSGPGGLRGVVILGISPRLRFDDKYREFTESVGQQLAATIAAQESKETERALLEREQAARREAVLQREHLVSLLTQAPAPMAVLRGPQLIIELANPLACQVWGRAHADVIDRPIFEALPELRGQVYEELLERVYRTGVPYSGTEVPFQLSPPDAEPQELYLSFVYSPLRRVDGEVDGVLVIGFDVTDQVRARQQLDELKSAAEAANRAKDEFFAVLGHELRNPLAPILTALELMRMRDTGELVREREIIERQARHLVRLVDDLLDVSRIARGKVTLQREPRELAGIVDRAVELARPLFDEGRHELVVDVAAEGLVVHADVERLAQAIANLLTNAAKYTERGGRIVVHAERSGSDVRISVRDNGIGMAPEMLPRVFGAFVQEPQALDRSRGGLGLGLAIVRGIMELHGGSAEARSDGPGTGSELILRIPAADGTPVGAPGPERANRASTSPRDQVDGDRRVLIVDDNEDAAALLATWLENAGYHVHVAHDAVSGLRAAERLLPSIALLDLGLPVMDGYELGRRLRDLPGLERLPLIAVTGYGRPSDRELSKRIGFTAHMVKPVDVHELDALIRSCATPPGDIRAPGEGRS